MLTCGVLSAGYGLVPHDRRLAPYEATFTGMKKAELTAWAEQLAIPAAIRQVLAEPYDLGLILLGDSYLATCRLDDSVQLGGPTVLFCGPAAAKRVPALERLQIVPLSYAATVSELPDVTEYGDTWHEAYELATDTICTAAEMYAEAGRVFPSPE